MGKDKITIKQFVVDGIYNPNVTIIGECKNGSDKDFVLKIDGEKIEHNRMLTPLKNEFILNAVLSRKTRLIELYLVDSDTKKEIFVAKKTTNLLKRAIQKMASSIARIFIVGGRIAGIFKRGIAFLWREHHLIVPPKLWPKYYHDFRDSLRRRSVIDYNPMVKSDYLKWLRTQETPALKDIKYMPLISILVPVYNVEEELLEECVNSVLNQSYKEFELCLVDDCSSKESTIEKLKELEQKDERIKVKYRKKNGHISMATNDALKMAKGEFVALLDNDDILDKDALYRVVEVLNEDKNIDFIYSDEDKLDLDGRRCEPHFKPDFSPDTLLSVNYICHFTVIRKKLVEEVGGFEQGLEGAQDHDLFLKVSEKTDKIYHIPMVLYHWRKTKGSTALSGGEKSYANDKGKIAIENALKRRKIKGKVEVDSLSKYYQVYYEVEKEPLVSIIIPTRDYCDILKKCVESIYKKTTYKNFEIIVANNDSKEQETLDYFDECKKKHKNFKVVDCLFEFNYSKINNMAVNNAKGEYIVLLNNDTEVISGDWLSVMVGYASQKHIGVVGAKLYYPDETVQHAGVVLGLGGVASHVYIGATKEDTGLYGRLRVPYNYSACTAACFMIKREIYEKVNGLNEELKVAYNDIDFCVRVLEEGYYNVCVPMAELMHYESKSRGLDTTTEKYKRFLVESKYMYDHWNKYIENDAFYNKNYSKRACFRLDK